MTLLKIEEAVFKNKDGKLIAEEFEMVDYEAMDEEIVPTMKLVPLVGDVLKDFIKNANNNDDAKAEEVENRLIDILIKHIEEPKFTIEQFKIIKPMVLKSIMKTVMVASGVPLDRVTIKTKSEKKQPTDE